MNLDPKLLLLAAFVRRQFGQVAFEGVVKGGFQAREQRVQHRGSRKRGRRALPRSVRHGAGTADSHGGKPH